MDIKKLKEEWWFPEVTDETWINRMRNDYSEAQDMDADEIRDYYNDGRKYSITWDHIGDAYEEYEKLADAFLQLLEECKK